MNHQALASFIWSVADLLRGDYKQSEYGRVILPFTVLRRLDCVLEPTKAAVLTELKAKTAVGLNPEPFLLRAAKHSFYNADPLDLPKLIGDQDNIRANLSRYVEGFSPAVRDIFEQFDFHTQIDRLAKTGLLYQVTEKFTRIDLHPERVDNAAMGLAFEELIRKFAEISNETAGEHFTPATRFLPFNKGDNGGAGNPTNPNGHRTAYLWEEVLERESWLEILGRYLVAQRDAKRAITGLIFPRYHQLDATRTLAAAVRAEGPGGRYLIQHSAGSGKTNSIAWAAHFLADLHDAAELRVLPVETAEAVHGAEFVAGARERSRGLGRPAPVEPLQPEQLIPSCFGLPAPLDVAAEPCSKCPLADQCRKASEHLLADVVEHHGSTDPTLRHRRELGRDRVRRFREKARLAAVTNDPVAGASAETA